MNVIIVVSTNWGRPDVAARPGGGVYDYSTPLDTESTLPRLLESLT